MAMTSNLVMRAHHLLKEHLEYELKVRGVDAGEMTVLDMRSSLRSMLKLESSGTVVHYPEYQFGADVEIPEIEELYKALLKSVTEFTGAATDSLYGRLQSRVLHLIGRVDRIPLKEGNGITQDTLKKRGSLMAKASALLGTLDDNCKREARRNISGVLNGTVASSSSDDGEGATEDSSASAPASPALNSTRIRHARASRQPVYKWGLRFSGDPKGLSVSNFLERVEELRVARGMSMEELFESSLDLFDGKALLWYRSVIKRCKTWDDLGKLLTRHYLPPDYNARLLQEILSRTQGPNESIVEYLACMAALFARYGKVGPDVQLDITVRNLAPFYTMQLPVVRSLEELEQECLKLEVKKYRAETYQAPAVRSRVRGAVEPDLAYVSSASGASTSSRDRIHEISHSRIPPDVVCFNCRGTGHRFRNCPAPRRMHCFRCQRDGVTVRTCPSCSPVGVAEPVVQENSVRRD